MIESALRAPATRWGVFQKYGDLPAKAAALLYALAKIQPCVDGNKRVTLLLVDAFVSLNGGEFLTQPGELADKILATAESDAGDREEVVAQLTTWMRTSLVPPAGGGT
jgi:death-on-curing protein